MALLVPLLRTSLTRATAAFPARRLDTAVTMAAHRPLPKVLSGAITHKALLLDAAGTLFSPAQPAARIYRQFAAKYGVTLSEDEILARYRTAIVRRKTVDVWTQPTIRYIGDGRDFWRYVVGYATGCDSEALLEELYEYYARPEAWNITPGAVPALRRLRDRGVKVVVVSNFDTRLRPLLMALGLGEVLDEVVVSAEVGAEKPNPAIFARALELTGLRADEVVHVGDDRRNDLWGARDAGMEGWLWGKDVKTFRQLADRILGCSSEEED